MVSVDRRDFDRQALTTQRVHDLREAYLNSDLLAQTKATVAEEVNSRSRISGTSRRTRSPGWFRVFSTVTAYVGSYFHFTMCSCAVALFDLCMTAVLLVFNGLKRDTNFM